MNEEILRVLKMIEDGIITAEEGKSLIEAVEETTSNSSNESLGLKKNSGKKRMLRVVVDARGEGAENAKVRVNIPLDVAKKAAGFTSLIPAKAKQEMQENGIDIDAMDIGGLIDMFLNGEIDENLVDVEAGDSEKGATVKVYVD